ncbi:helix-turn-helix domain-containing protein [Saccharothrix sp. NRRL B-16348]|uniref:helix-turn-helix domain-containing protein n=1 Tax=Saccharothrix sp. NRRL B-16348 TaxID=1415542 RepID=UPI0006B06609|nr:helix-turn-helix domain-containing protein [Saccharothrix sp. NRRL B-16348]
MVNQVPDHAYGSSDHHADRQATADLDRIAPELPDRAGGGRLLHTPAQAARALSVRESWLRRMAGRQEIPCTLLGKHLRFSDADLRSIVHRGSRSARRDAMSRPEAHGPYSRRRQG